MEPPEDVEGLHGGVRKQYVGMAIEGFAVMLQTTLQSNAELRLHITLDLAEVCKVVPKEKLPVSAVCQDVPCWLMN